jgi:Methyltransferase FkbM domain
MKRNSKILFSLGLAFLLLSNPVLMSKPKLSEYGFNKYSQFGEDGIIKKIFEIIGTTSKTCIEFGAWDGYHFSNTALLWSLQGWKAILIECEEERFGALEKNVKNFDCLAVHARIGIAKNDSLDTLLKNYLIEDQIDLLSIDIDGDDYYIFQSLNNLRPRVVICEYNPTLPALLDIYPEHDNYIGCSAAALVRIAQEKGYRLVALTDTNCFFVLEEEFEKFKNFETSLKEIKTDFYLKYIMSSYAGEYLVVGDWEKTPYGMSKPYSKRMNGNFHTLNVRISVNK